MKTNPYAKHSRIFNILNVFLFSIKQRAFYFFIIFFLIFPFFSKQSYAEVLPSSDITIEENLKEDTTPVQSVEGVTAGEPLNNLTIDNPLEPVAEEKSPSKEPLTYETIIVSVSVNGVNKGDTFILRSSDSSFFLSIDDAGKFEVNLTTAAKYKETIEGADYLNLSTVEGLQIDFDLSSLTLKIVIPRNLLKKDVQIFDLGSDLVKPGRGKEVNTYFFNYGFNYTNGDSVIFPKLEMTNEIGFRRGNSVFITDGFYYSIPDESNFFRLNSRLIYDDVETMTRTTFGDDLSYAGSLGGSLPFIGVSYKKNFSMVPYFKKYGLIDFKGYSELPSTLEIVSDGITKERFDLEPGEYEVKNFFDSLGARNVEFVLTDSLGRIEKINIEKYISSQMLKKGLHDYNYSIGLERINFATVDDKYEDFTFSLFHEFGAMDWLNVRGLSYSSRSNYGFGAGASLLLSRYGIISTDIAGSGGDAGSGFASNIRYSYRNPNFINVELYRKDITENFANLNGTSPLKANTGALLSYGNRFLGTFAYVYNDNQYNDDTFLTTSTIKYLRTFLKHFRASVSQTFADNNGNTYSETYISLHFYPLPFLYFAVDKLISDKGLEKDITSIRLQKGRPIGTGVGYNLAYILEEEDIRENKKYEGTFYYNNNYFNSKASYTKEENDTGGYDYYNVSVAGSILGIGKKIGMSRPVKDSFALFKMGDLKNVRVKANNIEAGRTSKNGYLWLPELHSYTLNQISIEDSDVPIEYHIDEKRKRVTPSYREGICVDFKAYRSQFLVGSVAKLEGEELVPLEYVYIKTTKNGEDVILGQTGSDGEFYVENSVSKSYKTKGDDCFTGQKARRLVNPGEEIFAVKDDEKCYFTYELKFQNEVFVEMGPVICEVK